METALWLLLKLKRRWATKLLSSRNVSNLQFTLTDEGELKSTLFDPQTLSDF
jgi:hypothetical protein